MAALSPRSLLCLGLLFAPACALGPDGPSDIAMGPAASSGPAGAGEAEPAPPFQAGERFDYEIRVLGIPAASAFVETERQGNDWALTGFIQARPWLETFYRLALRLETRVDGDSLRTKHLIRDGVNGARETHREAKYRKGGRVRVKRQTKGGKARKRWRRTHAEARDPLALLLAMRQAMQAGRIDGSVWHGFDGVWTRRISIDDLGPETAESPAGTYRCRKLRVRSLRVQVKGDSRRIPKKAEDLTWTVWVMEGSPMVVVRAEGTGPFGPATVVLERARTGRAIASAR
jgi:hypothetical protein